MSIACCHSSSCFSLKKKIAPSQSIPPISFVIFSLCCFLEHLLLLVESYYLSFAVAARKSKYAGQAIKAIPIRVLTVGKRRSKGTQLLVEEYTQKIKYYCNIEDTLIKNNPKDTSDVRSQIEAEDMVMVQHIRPDDFVVMMDENGKDVVSEEMADLIGDAANKGSTRLTFCIGGPYGHGPLVRERADVGISLSSLVLNHQVALIVLLEQIYRLCYTKLTRRGKEQKGKEEHCAPLTSKQYSLHSDLGVTNLRKIHSVFTSKQYSFPLLFPPLELVNSPGQLRYGDGSPPHSVTSLRVLPYGAQP